MVHDTSCGSKFILFDCTASKGIMQDITCTNISNSIGISCASSISIMTWRSVNVYDKVTSIRTYQENTLYNKIDQSILHSPLLPLLFISLARFHFLLLPRLLLLWGLLPWIISTREPLSILFRFLFLT